MSLKRRIYGLVGRQLTWVYARMFRAMTLGARVVVFDAEDRVLLVKHTYTPGWHFPGGGVERGETMVMAALREVFEEAGIIAQDAMLHGIFSQEAAFSGDHIGFYVVRNFTRVDWKPDGEIAAAQFFARNELPSDTTDATLRRLAEIFDGVAISEQW